MKMQYILYAFIPACCQNKNKRSSLQVIFQKGETMVQNEINLFTLTETLMKIKASLTILVGENHNQLKQIQT